MAVVLGDSTGQTERSERATGLMDAFIMGVTKHRTAHTARTDLRNMVIKLKRCMEDRS